MTRAGLLLGAALAFGVSLPLAAQTSETEFQAARHAGQITEQNRLGATQMNCTLRPSQEVALSAPFDGIVSEVFVRPGQKVAQGTLLMRLDTRLDEAELALLKMQADATASLAAAERVTALLRTRVTRLKEAFDKEAIAFGVFEQAQLDMARAEAELDKFREDNRISAARLAPLAQKIAMASVHSPVAGRVGEDLLDPGESTMGAPLASLIVLDPLRVEVFMPSAMLPMIEAGATLSLTVAGQSVPAEQVQFDYIAPRADYASGTVSVFLHLTTATIRPGSTCIAHVLLS